MAQGKPSTRENHMLHMGKRLGSRPLFKEGRSRPLQAPECSGHWSACTVLLYFESCNMKEEELSLKELPSSWEHTA